MNTVVVPLTQPATFAKVKNLKNKRYRDKCIREGRCPHCGQPCAPYYECDKRRFYKKMEKCLRRLVKERVLRCEDGRYLHNEGSDEKFNNIVTYSISPDDRRKLARIKNRPIDLKQLLREILFAHPNGITEDNIRVELAARRLESRL